MATTRTIELKTAIPGPRSREILERKERVIADPLSVVPPGRGRGGARRDAHRRRRQHVHRLHRRRRLPERRALAPAGRRGGAGAARALLAHRLHDRPVRGLRRARRAADRARADRRPGEGRVLQRRHRGGRERDQVRARLHEAARRDRLRGRVPRAHAALADADLEDAPVQGRASGRSRPRSTACRSRTTTAGRDAATALAALERAFVTQVAAENVAAIVVEPVQGEGGFVVAPREFMQGLRRICDEHGIVLVVDEVQTGFGRTGQDVRDRALRRRARPDDRREVDRRRPAALGRARQGGDHGRAGRLGRSAAPTSATRSRRPPRSPSST